MGRALWSFSASNFSTHSLRLHSTGRERERERERGGGGGGGGRGRARGEEKCDRGMRRGADDGINPAGGGGKRRRRAAEGGGGAEEVVAAAFVNLDEDLLFEVLKHVDARTLATAACVSRQWKRTAHDERLWEMICTRHWANVGCGSQQLRSVVLALGGFRRLHALCLWPLLKSPSPSPSSSQPPRSSPFPPPAVPSKKPPTRWGKDEVHLSLSLLSIRFYEKMSSKSKGS